jgi:hypothetical protein
VRKTAIPQKQQRGTPHRWLRDPQTADTLHAIDERCLDFKELPARSLVLCLSKRDSACQRHATHNPRWRYIEFIIYRGFVVRGISA